jgi:hypothetical protein
MSRLGQQRKTAMRAMFSVVRPTTDIPANGSFAPEAASHFRSMRGRSIDQDT